MAFVDLKESRRFASPCPFKQKFVCDSLWQTALDPVGIVPTIITGKRLKDTLVEQNFSNFALQTPVLMTSARQNRVRAANESGLARSNSSQTMALDAFRGQTVDGEIPRN
jgi:hypothetical protein